MHVTPGMALSIVCIVLARRSNAARIIATSSSDPDTAASAARWQMFATFEVAPNKAVEFWNCVCDAIGYKSKQDARWQLRHYIDTHTASKSDSKSFIADERWYRMCIVAWNRWRNSCRSP